MDLKVLTQEFKEIVNAFWEVEDEIKYLRIELNVHEFDEVINLSKQISAFLDVSDKSESNYILDVYSAGKDFKLNIAKLQDFINKRVNVELKTQVKGLLVYEGDIIDIQEENITIRWNAKGQFRKVTIDKENIKQIQLAFKF